MNPSLVHSFGTYPSKANLALQALGMDLSNIIAYALSTLVRSLIMITGSSDGDVENNDHFRKYSNANILSISLATEQAASVAIYPDGYCCSWATLLSFNRINDILTD
jgi:hypothetical protein